GQVFSSMGLPETIMRTDESLFKTKSRIGKMTFLESIFVFDKKPLTASDATIYFYNNAPTYAYRPAQNYFDATSAVVCLPDNYERSETAGEGTVRVTYMANYEQWRELERTPYEAKKDEVAESAKALIKKLMPEYQAQ